MSLAISLKQHIESLQSEIYFLREEIWQKTTSFQQYFYKISMLFPTFQNKRISSGSSITYAKFSEKLTFLPP